MNKKSEHRLRDADSRTASNLLLSELQRHKYSAAGIGSFLRASTARSVHQAFLRPCAVLEASVLHLALAAVAQRGARGWIGCSFALTVTHLGMLGTRRTLGVPNLLTLLRANLPAFRNQAPAAIPVLALATDFLDGKIARATNSTTTFGSYADFFADAAVWTWFSFAQEKRLTVRSAVIAAWIVPVSAVIAVSIYRGRIVEITRSRWFRPSALVELVVGGRAVFRLLSAARRPRVIT